MTQILSEVFYTFLITSVIGFIIALGRMCYKSKCSTIDLCCMRIVRNVEIEVRQDIELGISPKDTESNKV